MRSAVENLPETVLVGLGQIEEAGALGAKRSFVDGMIGIAFDVEDLARCLVDAADQTAADGTVTADRRYLLGRLDAVHLAQLIRIGLGRIQVDPQGGQGNPAIRRRRTRLRNLSS